MGVHPVRPQRVSKGDLALVARALERIVGLGDRVVRDDREAWALAGAGRERGDELREGARRLRSVVRVAKEFVVPVVL